MKYIIYGTQYKILVHNITHTSHLEAQFQMNINTICYEDTQRSSLKNEFHTGYIYVFLHSVNALSLNSVF